MELSYAKRSKLEREGRMEREERRYMWEIIGIIKDKVGASNESTYDRKVQLCVKGNFKKAQMNSSAQQKRNSNNKEFRSVYYARPLSKHSIYVNFTNIPHKMIR